MSSSKKSGGKAGRRARRAIRLPAKAPRNPVVLALVRKETPQKAGRHERPDKAERRAQKMLLKKQLDG